MHTYDCKTKILSGPGATEAVSRFAGSRLLLVADPFFQENGTVQRLLSQWQIPHTQLYTQVYPDPTVEQVACGVAALKEFAPDTVVALGGGSAMDCAKAMVYFSRKKVTFVAIPTTSGSGSEVTDFAVLTHDGVKYPLVDPSLQPDIAILDSQLLTQMPPGLVADCGFDVLAHALEGYVGKNAGGITDAMAEKAFCTAFALLPRSFAGETAVRLPMHEASTLAAMAFNRAGLGLCHALSHAMGGLYHLPHGRLNAIVLPAVVECNSALHKKKYAHLAQLAGLGGMADTVAVRNLKNGLQQLRKQLRLPATLIQAGVSPAVINQTRKQVIEAALADPCCETNPVPVDAQIIQSLWKEISGCGG